MEDVKLEYDYCQRLKKAVYLGILEAQSGPDYELSHNEEYIRMCTALDNVIMCCK